MGNIAVLTQKWVKSDVDINFPKISKTSKEDRYIFDKGRQLYLKKVLIYVV